jgi:hypothetical protein
MKTVWHVQHFEDHADFPGVRCSPMGPELYWFDGHSDERKRLRMMKDLSISMLRIRRYCDDVNYGGSIVA